MNKYISIIFGISIFSLLSFNLQEDYEGCGVTINQDDIDYFTDLEGEYLNRFLRIQNLDENVLSNLVDINELNLLCDHKLASMNLDVSNINSDSGKRYVGLKLIVLRNSSGEGGISQTDFQNNILNKTNEAFNSANIEFEIAEMVSINDTDLYNYYFNYTYDKLYDEGYCEKYNNENLINVYLVERSDASFAHFPSHREIHVLLNRSQCERGSTFAHELGHYFGLWHTFTTYNGAEYVDQSNCSSTGDLICDTPADRKGLTFDSNNCTYTDNKRDNNGDYYRPLVDNLMSYYREYSSDCRSKFTPDQIKIVNFNLLNSRSKVILEKSIKKRVIPNKPFVTPGGNNQSKKEKFYAKLTKILESQPSNENSNSDLYLTLENDGVVNYIQEYFSESADIFGETENILIVNQNGLQFSISNQEEFNNTLNILNQFNAKSQFYIN